MKTALCGLILLTFAIPASGAEPMALEYSWKSVRFCREAPYNPVITLHNIPDHTVLIRFRLEEATGGVDYGGGDVIFSGQSEIAADQLGARAPCKLGPYTWTAVALDEAGSIIATASRTSTADASSSLP